MTGGDPFNAVWRLVADQEPAGLRNYIAAPVTGAVYHAGTMTPALGRLRQLPSGLWVPSGVTTELAPIDLMAVYVTFEEVVGFPASFDDLIAAVSQHHKVELLLTIGKLLRFVQRPGDERNSLEIEWSRVLRQDVGDKLRRLLKSGRHLLTRQGLMALAKLAIVHGGNGSHSQIPIDHAIGFLILGVHDQFGHPEEVASDERFGGFPLPLAASIIANQWFNRNLDEANFLSLYEGRWRNAERKTTQSARSAFVDALGVSLDSQTDVALALWAGSKNSGFVAFTPAFLEPLGLTDDQLSTILSLISIDLTDAAARIARNELELATFEWTYDTFEQFPVLRLEDGRLAVLEPSTLLQRCLGWAPIYDIRSKVTAHTMALSTEEYALDVLSNAFGNGPAKRLFTANELEALARASGSRSADAAIDFGPSWVVLEITARRVLRGVVHGDMNLAALQEQIDVVLEEVSQIAGTAYLLETDAGALTGTTNAAHIKIYPIVVMAEGFPTNPVMLTEIRKQVALRGLLDQLDAADVEVIDLVELEMIESIAQAGGPSLPELLDAKARSNFSSDSVRNFLLSRPGSNLRIGERIQETFAGPLMSLARRLPPHPEDERER